MMQLTEIVERAAREGRSEGRPSLEGQGCCGSKALWMYFSLKKNNRFLNKTVIK